MAIDVDGPDMRFRLRLDDLIPGAAGEVVLFNDSALREVVLLAANPPETTGEIDEHVTAEGVDVGGYRYLRFAPDLVVFHAPDTRLTLELTRS